MGSVFRTSTRLSAGSLRAHPPPWTRLVSLGSAILTFGAWKCATCFEPSLPSKARMMLFPSTSSTASDAVSATAALVPRAGLGGCQSAEPWRLTACQVQAESPHLATRAAQGTAAATAAARRGRRGPRSPSARSAHGGDRAARARRDRWPRAARALRGPSPPDEAPPRRRPAKDAVASAKAVDGRAGRSLSPRPPPQLETPRQAGARQDAAAGSGKPKKAKKRQAVPPLPFSADPDPAGGQKARPSRLPPPSRSLPAPKLTVTDAGQARHARCSASPPRPGTAEKMRMMMQMDDRHGDRRQEGAEQQAASPMFMDMMLKVAEVKDHTIRYGFVLSDTQVPLRPRASTSRSRRCWTRRSAVIRGMKGDRGHRRQRHHQEGHHRDAGQDRRAETKQVMLRHGASAPADQRAAAG